MLFEMCKRDYSAQEVAAIILKFKSVVCTHKFAHFAWKGDSRETADSNAGEVATRYNPREIYLRRTQILDSEIAKQRAKKKPDPAVLIELRNMREESLACNFLEFFRLFEGHFNEASRKTLQMWERHHITRALEPHLRVPVLVPDLPTSLRDPAHPSHEAYCEYRAFTLIPHASEAHWDAFVADARELAVQEAAKLAADCEAADSRKGKSEAPKAPKGPFHLAYEAYLADIPEKYLMDKTTTRTGRLLHVDSYGFNAEVDGVYDYDDIDGTPEHDMSEDWMGDLRTSIKAIEDYAIESVVPQSHWDEIWEKYESHPSIKRNWVAEAAARGDIQSKPFKEPVDVASSLNAEQHLVFTMLTDHYHAMVNAARDGTTAPPPLRMLVYGKGGTGKTHILRAFREYIDNCAASEQEQIDTMGDGDERQQCPLRFPSTWNDDDEAKYSDKHKGESYRDVHMNQKPLSSDFIVCAMAPSAQAAVSIDGDTLHGSLKLPRSNKRLPNDINIEKGHLASLERKHRLFEYYFVDEVGMMGTEQFGAANSRLRQAHAATTSDSDLGGRSCILFGHHAQLPPVKDRRAFPDPGETDGDLTALQQEGRRVYMDSFDQVVILREQRRQYADDDSSPEKKRRIRKFVQILDRIETCTITEADWLYLKEQSDAIVASGGFDETTQSRLCSRKSEKGKENLAKLLVGKW